MYKITDDIIQRFLNVENLEDLCDVLNVPSASLNFYLFKNSDNNYNEYSIPKKDGTTRIIAVPTKGLKNIQKALAQILAMHHLPKSCVHGFIKNRSIKTNANIHKRKNIIVSLDLKDFFPTIHFGRIQGLFNSSPFNFNKNIANNLANLCCYNGYLPQGAPTSPILSNYICRKLDNELLSLCRESKCSYSRYADDITISTSLKELPESIGIIQNKNLTLSREIVRIIENNTFSINTSKTRYSKYNNKQRVTGLIVNKKVNVDREYVRNVRAILNAWEKYGLTNTVKTHYIKSVESRADVQKLEKTFKLYMRGRIQYIGHIRGKDDKIYNTLFDRLSILWPELNLPTPEISNNDSLDKPKYKYEIWCEGPSDWKHLKKALLRYQEIGEFLNLNLVFREWVSQKDKINNDELLKHCESYAKITDSTTKYIFIFDRDKKTINKKVMPVIGSYLKWSGYVFSFILPKPSHRNFDEICIEHFYNDSDLKLHDESGYRIFTSDEFNPVSLTHKNEKEYFVCTNIEALKNKYPYILDKKVFDKYEKNWALPKNKFADYILMGTPPFHEVSFEHFKLIFDIIQTIINSE